jgi:response regulator of citrate/malate metabolism
MPVSIDPKDQKIWNYFTERRTPVTIRQVMKALLVSETHARRALEYFVFRELAERHKVGGVMTYKVKE